MMWVERMWTECGGVARAWEMPRGFPSRTCCELAEPPHLRAKLMHEPACMYESLISARPVRPAAPASHTSPAHSGLTRGRLSLGLTHFFMTSVARSCRSKIVMVLRLASDECATSHCLPPAWSMEAAVVEKHSIEQHCWWCLVRVTHLNPSARSNHGAWPKLPEGNALRQVPLFLEGAFLRGLLLVSFLEVWSPRRGPCGMVKGFETDTGLWTTSAEGESRSLTIPRQSV